MSQCTLTEVYEIYRYGILSNIYGEFSYHAHALEVGNKHFKEMVDYLAGEMGLTDLAVFMEKCDDSDDMVEQMLLMTLESLSQTIGSYYDYLIEDLRDTLASCEKEIFDKWEYALEETFDEMFSQYEVDFNDLSTIYYYMDEVKDEIENKIKDDDYKWMMEQEEEEE